ncbi:MAG TPA: DUF2382 domain-containing protein [Thermoanaerobaculia bacterium]|nr:DUF2382 domain-containing protein [Thermoanaerobaculia bacterium]
MKNSDTSNRASMGSSTATDTSNLVPMSGLNDYKVADGNPDVRGWDVIARDGKKVGEVEDLLVDPSAERVRYLVVNLDSSLRSGGRGTGYVLVPVGNARLDDSKDGVILDSMNDADVATLPAYDRDMFNRDHETSLRQRFDQNYTRTEGTGGDFYSHDLYDEDRFYGSRRQAGRAGVEDEARLTLSEEELAVGKRREQAGEFGVRKRVETEHVQQSVPVMHEEVTVERRPVTAGTGTSAQIGEDEIRVPLTKEEVIMEKRVVPKEELVIKKHLVEGEETVEADVRRERAEVLNEGDVDLNKRR